MGRKKKSRKRDVQNTKRVKITPASLIGICMGLIVIGAGLYSAIKMKENGGFYVVVLGAILMAGVIWGSVRKR